MSDGKEAKFLIVDDLHDTKVADFSKLEGIGKQWYEHCVGRSNLTVLGGTVMSKGDLKRSKTMSKLQVKIDGEWKDFCGIKESDYSVLWIRNWTMLKNGEFGDTKLSETLLAYWKAQELAGYPCAEENVRYFEDMVRKESGNAKN